MGKQAFLRFGKIALDVTLLCLVFGVIVQNRLLLSRLRQQADAQGAAVGHRVGNLASVALDGAITPIELPGVGGKLLIIGMSPRCPACQKNRGGWVALTSALKQHGGWRVIWISRDPLDETREYFSSLGIGSADGFADPPFRTYAQLGLLVVPRMIAVLPGGRVDRVWTGQLSAESWKEAFSYFGLPTPESQMW